MSLSSAALNALAGMVTCMAQYGTAEGRRRQVSLYARPEVNYSGEACRGMPPSCQAAAQRAEGTSCVTASSLPTSEQHMALLKAIVVSHPADQNSEPRHERPVATQAARRELNWRRR